MKDILNQEHSSMQQRKHLSPMEKWVLRRAHPVAVIVDLGTLVWSVYFLWWHNWIAALAIGLAGRMVSVLLVRNSRLEEIAETTWGRLALLHLHPVNLVIQSAAVLLAIWGIWAHSDLIIISGVTLLIWGHAFGWNKVNPIFSVKSGTVS
jgi:hypothetical protein